MEEIRIKCNECNLGGDNATFLVIRPSLEYIGLPTRYVSLNIYDAANRAIYGVALNEVQSQGLVTFLENTIDGRYDLYRDGNLIVTLSRNENVTFTVSIMNLSLDRTYTLN